MKGLIPLFVLGIVLSTKAQQGKTCPNVSEDPPTDILLPHESDCTKFYKCSHGEAVLLDCPSDLHFNPEKDQCDWPQNVDCENNNGEDGDNSEIQSSGEDDNTCPTVVEDPETDILLPHESDCSKFYKCSFGEKTLQDCPAGLYYNPEMRYCDWPLNTNCTNGTASAIHESSGEEDNTCPTVVEDPETDILLPHESDCSKFYKCSFGEKTLQDCPAGLYYNPEMRYCDWPLNTNCTNGTASAIHESSGEEDNTCPTVVEDPETDILLPHESDCSKFYKCSFGEKTLQDCPAGLYYNPEMRYCDWPLNTNCTNGTASAIHESSGEEDNTCPTVVEDPETDILLPHESDCSKFYKCSFGEKTLQDCPAGLYYNPEMRYCDWPLNTNCTNGTASAIHESSGEEDNTCPTVVEDPETDILLPHESDCSKFYKCSFGEKTLQDCPAGLYYNPEMRYCDWPLNTNCTNGTASAIHESSGEEDNSCPTVVEDPETDILLPHESDCSKFYKCSFGEKTLQDCPAGLYYNPEMRYCDWPLNTNCTNGTASAIHESSGEEDNTCPTVVEDPETDILLPHESDCSKFYKCSFGEKTLQDCPAGLYYNPEMRYCDWPLNTNCTNGTASAIHESSGEEDNTCPTVVEDPETDILLPHESDCSKFYKCSFGEKTLQDCPAGLYYNPEMRYCDWPLNTNCTNGTASAIHESSGEDDNTCPTVVEDPETDILLPHESDCSKFYKCSFGEKTLQDCPAGLYYNPEMRYCDWPLNTNCTNGTASAIHESSGEEDNTCPTVVEDPETDILLPHESDCSKFYKCSFGEKTLQDCPAGLYYNPEMRYCDWPLNTNCTNGTASAIHESSGEEDNTCPTVVEDPETDILLPHESDCSKFYKCSFGEKTLQDCPAGLYYNPERRYCDWPLNTNCTNGTASAIHESSGEEDNTCPTVVEDPETDILLPHESDCSKFYKCSFGEKTLQDCPAGLYYNPEMRYCDWPLNTNCTNGTASAIHESSGEEDNTCPTVVEDPETDILLPHESDCSKFYKCSFGEKTLQDCPAGLYYNPERRYCDWPLNTNCTNNGTASATHQGQNQPSNDDEIWKNVINRIAN